MTDCPSFERMFPAGGRCRAVIVVVMGVAGSGKTTVGKLLARRLGCGFYEGDDYHAPASIEKMSSGVPLDDADRWPWLEGIRRAMRARRADGECAVFACSALRGAYRTYLEDGTGDVHFVYLKGDESVLRERLEARRGHYMGAAMLDSQLGILEEPDDAILADVSDTPEHIVAQVCSILEAARDD